MLSAVGKEPGGRLGAQERREMINERRWETQSGGQMQKDQPWERKKDPTSCGAGEGSEDGKRPGSRVRVEESRIQGRVHADPLGMDCLTE